MGQFIDNIVSMANDALYTYILVILLVAGGIYFTVRTKFVQFRLFGEQLRCVMEKPDKLDEMIMQEGKNLSGGQRQRLLIARAVCKKPKILILDDSTSAVDTATEAKIREAFATTLKDSTKIIIAQRISSVMYADRILVLDDGKIVGLGTHKELLNNCDEYREIYSLQTESKEVASNG